MQTENRGQASPYVPCWDSFSISSMSSESSKLQSNLINTITEGSIETAS